MSLLRFSFCLGLLACSISPTYAEQSTDLFDLSIEQLLAIKVEVASRRPERLQDTAAAISVITAEDIRQSGASSLPEILRLIPGVYVSRLDSSKWSVSIRGFHSRFANKLLVLMDGRTLYSPLFSGVYWELQDNFFPDIERIEVIRGPGGSLWGSNAVNGIINIITRKATSTPGLALDATLGTNSLEHRVGMRYGIETDSGATRFYVQETKHDGGLWPGPEYGNNGYYPVGDDAFDDWQRTITGFRHDGQSGEQQWQIQGQWLDAEFRQIRVARPAPGLPITALPDTVLADGYSLQGRHHTPLSSGQLEVLAFFDHSARRDASFDEVRDTIDFDLQYQDQWHSYFPQQWSAGFGYRRTEDDVRGLTSFILMPEQARDEWLSAFFHDQITLVPERWMVAVGIKFEHNKFTSLEQQPNVRLTWTPTSSRTVWAAWSDTVRLPSRSERDAFLRLPDGSLLALGNPNLDSEQMRAIELGWRESWGTFSSDITAFQQRYDELISNTVNVHDTVDIEGVEWELRWQPQRNLDVVTYATWYQDDARDSGDRPLAIQHTDHIRIQWTTDGAVSLSAEYTRNGHLRTTSTGVEFGNFDILDIGIHWQALAGQWSLLGRNLIDPERVEDRDTTRLSTLTESSVELRYRTGF